jgi:hypothetical protein
VSSSGFILGGDFLGLRPKLLSDVPLGQIVCQIFYFSSPEGTILTSLGHRPESHVVLKRCIFNPRHIVHRIEFHRFLKIYDIHLENHFLCDALFDFEYIL